MKVTISQLREWFNEFNEKYFNNELPVCTFTINNRCTKRLGQYNCRLYKIDITNTYEREEKWFKETLIHEMVHHYVWVKYRKRGHKGYFAQMANYLNSKYGWHIETYAHLQRDENICPIQRTRKKPQHSLLTMPYKGKTFVCLVSDKFKDSRDFNYYQKNYDISIHPIIKDSPILNKFSICRSRLHGNVYDNGNLELDKILSLVG